jgi:hypothetical protein
MSAAPRRSSRSGSGADPLKDLRGRSITFVPFRSPALPGEAPDPARRRTDGDRCSRHSTSRRARLVALRPWPARGLPSAARRGQRIGQHLEQPPRPRQLILAGARLRARVLRRVGAQDRGRLRAG